MSAGRKKEKKKKKQASIYSKVDTYKLKANSINVLVII